MSKENIALIVLDSVSASKLSCQGHDRETTPFLDKLAKDNLFFSSTHANSSWTVPVHATLFSGLYPSEHGSGSGKRSFKVDTQETLAYRLSEAGYETIGFSSNPWVSKEFSYDKGFQEFRDVTPPQEFSTDLNPEDFLDIDDVEGWRKYTKALKQCVSGSKKIEKLLSLLNYKLADDAYANADIVNNKIESWIESRSNSEPFFMFVNYMDAHEPYEPSKEHIEAIGGKERKVDISWHLRSIDEEYTDVEKESINDLYDASLRYLDSKIAELFQMLERKGELDNTTVIVTSDHGKCLGEHGYMGVGTFLYDELIEVPLIISTADKRSENIKQPVDQIDIHNTIIDAAGVKSSKNIIEDDLDNEPKISETLGPAQPHVDVKSLDIPEKGYSRIDYKKSKLVQNNDDLRSELEAQNDSNEETRKEALQEKLDNWRSNLEHTDSDLDDNMDEEVKEQLEKLGYL
jgi:arylsulfatase A-like enzyme